jgi:hypothetical protein
MKRSKFMRTFKLHIILLVTAVFFSAASFSQQTNPAPVKEKSVKKIYPHVSIAPLGGAIFPLSKSLRDGFKPGGLLGLDIGYRLNKEVALYGKFSYIFMSSKISGAPIGSYLEFTTGPRYYFTHPKLNSSLFFEAGVGAYNFTQKSYVNPGDTTGAVIPQISDFKPGINGGVGVSLALSSAVDIMAKAKYHNIFTPNGSQGFMTVNGGIEFRFR